MYEQHLLRAENQFGKLNGFDDAEPIEKCIILLRQNNLTYSDISKWLGSLNKKIIRQVLLKYKPELIESDCNRHKLVSQQKSQEEMRIIGLIKKFNVFTFDLDEFGDSNFIIEDDLKFSSEEFNEMFTLKEFDERTRKSILYNIARILNINIKETEFTPQH